MYFAMVNNVWLGPAGAVMLGGLYWKRGTTRAAVATLSLGAAVGIGFIVVNSFWPVWNPQYSGKAFANPAALVTRLAKQERPMDRLVWSRISAPDQAELTALASLATQGAGKAKEARARVDQAEAALKLKMASLFNAAFLSTSTVLSADDRLMEGIKLSADAKAELAKASPLVANRILLNAAYDSIAKEEAFPINGQYMFLITILFSVALYGLVSRLDPQPAFNMEKMLHRGPYAVKGEELPDLLPTKKWQTLFGITPMFNRRDRLTAYLIVGWFLVWLGVFAAGMIYGAVADPGEAAWAKFWHVYLYIGFAVLVSTTLWLGIGGLRDLRNLLRSLASTERDFSDDGSVKHAPIPAAEVPAQKPRLETARR
jgi:hypothetical protein